MSERNEAMAAMLAADAPAARDFAFEIAVLTKIEQRRFRRGLVQNLALGLAAALLLAFIVPRLGLTLAATALSQLTGNGLVMAAMVLAAFAAWYFRPATDA